MSDAFTGKRGHDGGDGERKNYGRTGNRFGHGAGQHVHATPQSRPGAEENQVK